jgi:hypothetical protein
MMPQMKIRVVMVFPPHLLLPPIPRSVPKKDLSLSLLWWCPACSDIGFKRGIKGYYDGRFPHPPCPDCQKAEEAGQVASGDEAVRLAV